jgi:hypothetical protein
MRCPVCHKGTITRELWDMLYGVNRGLHTCGTSRRHLTDLKIWIGKTLDEIEAHGCKSCWSDSHSGCTCEAERHELRLRFLSELRTRLLPGEK